MATDFWYIDSEKFTVLDLLKNKNLLREKYIECLEKLIERLKEQDEIAVDIDTVENFPVYALPTVFFTEFKQDSASDYAVIRINCHRDRQSYIRHYKKEN